MPRLCPRQSTVEVQNGVHQGADLVVVCPIRCLAEVNPANREFFWLTDELGLERPFEVSSLQKSRQMPLRRRGFASHYSPGL
jgi:hypothetical protein